MSNMPHDTYAAFAELSAMDKAALLQTLTTISTVIGIFSLLSAVIMIASTWRIFRKAGTGGWKALIPIYSDYTIYKIAWKKKYFFMMLGFIILGSILPRIAQYFQMLVAAIIGAAGSVFTIAALVIDIISCVKLAKVFGKGGWFAVGIIFLPFIFLPILGYGKAKYRRRKRRRKKKTLPVPENT